MGLSKIAFPYHDSVLEIEVAREKLLGLCAPRERGALADTAAALNEALRTPLGTPPLRELVRPDQQVVIVVDDTTRKVPTPRLLDALIPELLEAGLELAAITVLVAVGLHRAVRRDEEETILGGWRGKVKLESHDARNRDQLVFVGFTSAGTSISVNRTFAEADSRILTGDVEYHQFCGYGGGAKSIYPGLADAEAIRSSHARMEQPGTGPGQVRGNPVREEIDEVGEMVGADFCLSTVLNGAGEMVSVHAGQLQAVFSEACGVVDAIYRRSVPARADLVIASAGGSPRDGSLYQAQKAIATAARVVEPGGEIVLIAACPEGSGSALFEEWMADAYEPEDIGRRLSKEFVMGGHKAHQITRDLRIAPVHLFSEIPPGKVRSWFLNPLRDIAEIERKVRKAERVIAIPQATTTLVEA